MIVAANSHPNANLKLTCPNCDFVLSIVDEIVIGENFNLARDRVMHCHSESRYGVMMGRRYILDPNYNSTTDKFIKYHDESKLYY